MSRTPNWANDEQSAVDLDDINAVKERIRQEKLLVELGLSDEPLRRLEKRLVELQAR